MSYRTVIQVRALYFASFVDELIHKADANTWRGKSNEAAAKWIEIRGRLEEIRKIAETMMLPEDKYQIDR